MVISHQHRYLFVEVPLTASWAIRYELCRHYGGTPILHKHATYPEFCRRATAAERQYFVFGTVRNPMDEVVSRYFRLVSDHKGVFSDPGRGRSLEAEPVDRQRYDFVRSRRADFDTFFLRYHRRAFGSLIDIDSDRYDAVIRYESLQADFSHVLRRLGIREVGPVPVTNATSGKPKDWASFYSERTRARAQRVFGPFMRKWGYEFPQDWPAWEPLSRHELEFRLLCWLRTVYMSRVRYDRGFAADALRRLRARLAG